MKRYVVNFFSFDAVVDAENEEEAEAQAWEMLDNGEINNQIESVEILKEEILAP